MRFRLSPHVSWTVEKNGVCLIDREQDRSRKLLYPEAAVWDFLSRSYSPQKTSGLIQDLCDIDQPAAAKLIKTILDDLCESGFLERSD